MPTKKELQEKLDYLESKMNRPENVISHCDFEMKSDEDLQAICSAVSDAMEAVKAGMDAIASVSKQNKYGIYIGND